MELDLISSHLADGFERDLFATALRNLADLENRLRFNNFAYTMRELMHRMLSRLAPMHLRSNVIGKNASVGRNCQPV